MHVTARTLLLTTLAVACAGTTITVTAAASSKPPLQPADVFSLAWVQSPKLSPDGRYVVYERAFYDPQTDRKRSNLWLYDLARGSDTPLTTGSANDGGVVWSPDSRRIAYVGADGEHAQIFVRWIGSSETARITQVPNGPGNLAFSPDGRWIAFTQHLPQRTKPLAELPPAPEGAKWAEPAKVIDRLVYRFDGAGYLDDGFTQLFVVASDGGAVRQVTAGDHNFDGTPEWSADGKSLFVSANLDPDWEYQAQESELYRISVDDGTPTRLTDRRGPDEGPVLSPDGKSLAYTGFDDRKLGFQNHEVYVLDLASGKTRSVSRGSDLDVGDPQWDGNGALIVHYDQRGVGRIGRIDLGSGKLAEIAADVGVTDLGRPYTGGQIHAAGGKIVYTRGSVERPADLGLIDHGKTRSLTALNENLLAHRTLGKVEEINYTSSAGQQKIQGWLVYPPDFDKSRKYPLLLEIHGGPYAAYGPNFAPETQLYAAHGYLVLYVNPRGSTSYGEAFASLIQNNYPGQDFDDLMSGVDTVIARGIVDEKKLFVTGGSGGGCLTAWIVGHTDRFAAAVVAKPVINWSSFVLNADSTSYFKDYWFASAPWEGSDEYVKRSPITYVGKVKTPTMMIVGESDYRTPISEAEQFYAALKLRKIDTLLVRLPGASHGINARPSQMLTQVLSTIGWFDRHAGAASPR
jgi:acylaminoacyl-peptidase